MAAKMVWTIQEDLLDDMINFCKQQLPHEACGFLYGQASDSAFHIHHMLRIPNCAAHPKTQFEMDPQHVIHATLVAPASLGTLVGLFHSHPNTPAIPSRQDLSTPWRTLDSHWIISLQHSSNPDIQIYRYTDTGYEAQHLRILPMNSKKAFPKPNSTREGS